MNQDLKNALPALVVAAVIGIGGFVFFGPSEAPIVEQDGPQRSIMLHSSNWEFQPNIIRLKQGENVALHLMGIQGDHGLAIPALGINERMSEGSSLKVTVPTDKTGTFPFFCNVSCGPGHADMEGTIIIE